VAIARALIDHATRLRRLALIDAPKGLAPNAVKAWRAQLDGAFAALYYPWIGLAGMPKRLEPPSGFVAGLIARVDIERGVWKAPANEVVKSADALEIALTDQIGGELNAAGVNCIRSLPGKGIRLWGARTLSADAEWRYVNVRRFMISLTRQIEKGLQPAVFEPNADPLWARMRRMAENVLYDWWRRGALMGIKPEQAYYVRCDRTTMTQNDVDNGRLVCVIGVALLKPAEFITVRIGQWTADRAA
jgi:phage tail sheath protein FI